MLLSNDLAHDLEHVRADVHTDNALHKRYSLGNDQRQEARFTSGIQEALAHTEFTHSLIPVGERSDGRIKVIDGGSISSGEKEQKTLQAISSILVPGITSGIWMKRANNPTDKFSIIAGVFE